MLCRFFMYIAGKVFLFVRHLYDSSMYLLLPPLDTPNSNLDTKPTLQELQNFTCTDGRVINIPVEVSADYTKFGTFLLDNSASTVKIIAPKHHYNAEQINTEILQEWLNGRGKQPVTWATLVKALYDNELFSLAGDIEAVKCLPRPG